MSEIKSTTNYGMFTNILGNRKVSKSHVTTLKNLIKVNGNMTDRFPIEVNSTGEVIDGQHRVEALKELGLPVYYRVVDTDATVETIRNINLGSRNWSWRDTAESYASLGNEEYRWLLGFIDEYDLTFSNASLFAGVDSTRHNGAGNDYNLGNMKIAEKMEATRKAKLYNRMKDILEFANRDMSRALVNLYKSPEFSEERFLKQLEKYTDRVPAKATRQEYMRIFEDIYNFGLMDANRKRLF